MMRLRVSLFVCALALLPLTACNRAEQQKKLIAIIVPSQDNPFFKPKQTPQPITLADSAIESVSMPTTTTPIARTI